jgi:hypothetical protein
LGYILGDIFTNASGHPALNGLRFLGGFLKTSKRFRLFQIDLNVLFRSQNSCSFKFDCFFVSAFQYRTLRNLKEKKHY